MAALHLRRISLTRVRKSGEAREVAFSALFFYASGSADRAHLQRVDDPPLIPNTGDFMDHEQKRHEKHEKERADKQAHERQSEENFSKPGLTIHPLWFLALGIVLTVAVVLVWMQF
jgi:hypothetical protein